VREFHVHSICSVSNIGTPADGLAALPHHAELKLTRQRWALARVLFGGGRRHLTARNLHDEAVAANVRVCLSTVYNTLQLFCRHGLLREVALGDGVTWFDTNVADHSHFFCEDTLRLIDSPNEDWAVGQLSIPEGYEVVKVDLVARLRPVRGT
jgi:Fur family iron response transcriptional regulator